MPKKPRPIRRPTEEMALARITRAETLLQWRLEAEYVYSWEVPPRQRSEEGREDRDGIY